ncbi:MAG TPA: PA2169 family four-helix-bundle protein [Terriglobales bacterium]
MASKAMEEITMASEKDVVKDVVQVLHDGHKGFMDLAEHIKDSEVKAFFVKQAQTRGEFARQLEVAAALPTDESGTAMGAVHRTWGDFKAKLGGGDHALLETAEQGEDAAKEAYEKALKEKEVTGNVRETLLSQQREIQRSHDQVKAFRDAKKAA